MYICVRVVVGLTIGSVGGESDSERGKCLAHPVNYCRFTRAEATSPYALAHIVKGWNSAWTYGVIHRVVVDIKELIDVYWYHGVLSILQVLCSKCVPYPVPTFLQC